MTKSHLTYQHFALSPLGIPINLTKLDSSFGSIDENDLRAAISKVLPLGSFRFAKLDEEGRFLYVVISHGDIVSAYQSIAEVLHTLHQS